MSSRLFEENPDGPAIFVTGIVKATGAALSATAGIGTGIDKSPDVIGVWFDCKKRGTTLRLL